MAERGSVHEEHIYVNTTREFFTSNNINAVKACKIGKASFVI
jgi:hypothetical protein